MISEQTKCRITRALKRLEDWGFNWEYVEGEPISTFEEFDPDFPPLDQGNVVEAAAEVVEEYLLLANESHGEADQGHFFASIEDAEIKAVEYKKAGWEVEIYNLDLHDESEPYTFAATYQRMRGDEVQALPLEHYVWAIREEPYEGEVRWYAFGPNFLNQKMAVDWHCEHAPAGTYRLYQVKSSGRVEEREGKPLDFIGFSVEEITQLTI